MPYKESHLMTPIPFGDDEVIAMLRVTYTDRKAAPATEWSEAQRECIVIETVDVIAVDTDDPWLRGAGRIPADVWCFTDAGLERLERCIEKGFTESTKECRKQINDMPLYLDNRRNLARWNR